MYALREDRKVRGFFSYFCKSVLNSKKFHMRLQFGARSQYTMSKDDCQYSVSEDTTRRDSLTVIVRGRQGYKEDICVFFPLLLL